jgi:hypothetical protein
VLFRSGEFLPEGYTEWQLEMGNHHYLGATMEERQLEQWMLEGDPIQPEELMNTVRKAMIVGGPKETWVIPEDIAKSLEEFRPLKEDVLSEYNQQVLNHWKKWALFNPKRVLRYSLNNLSGDTDIVLAYNPKIMLEFKQAAADLWKFHFNKGTLPEAVEKELLNGIGQGVLESGLAISEIPDINRTQAFKTLLNPQTGNRNFLKKGISTYWGSVTTFNRWRENTLRLAAFRHFKKVTKENQFGIYAASTKSQIDALAKAEIDGDTTLRSAKLARELIGDYGAVSHAGRYIRRHLIPFYSWMEVNAPRYVRLIANLPHEGNKSPDKVRTMGTLGLSVAAKGGALALKMNILYFLITAWNETKFPGEEQKIQGAKRQKHIILGRNSDTGELISMRFEGALSDALGWFGLDDYFADIGDLISGRADLMDKFVEAPKAGTDRLISSFTPLLKTPLEVAFGFSSFPTVFRDPGKSLAPGVRPIRDRWVHLGRTVSLDGLIKRITGKPRRNPKHEYLGAIANTLAYRTDPREAAYWETRQFAANWSRKELGREPTSLRPSEKSNALYYYKKSIQWGDIPAQARWRKRYMELGGSGRGLSQSVNLMDPLSAIPRKHRLRFIRSMDKQRLEAFSDARVWFRDFRNTISVRGMHR